MSWRKLRRSPTLQRVALGVVGLKQCEQRLHQRTGLGRVVTAKVADIHVQRHRAVFGPGVDTQMALGQQQRGGDPARAVGGGREAVKDFVHHLQPGGQRSAAAGAAQLCGVQQPCAVAAAVVEVSSQMEALHGLDCSRWPGNTVALTDAD